MLISEARVSLILKAILLFEAAVSLWNRQWLTSLITLGIVAITLVPVLLRRRFRIDITPQFEIMAIGFVFASLFLGEVRDYYLQYWWWDLVLHTLSGLLLGIIGFLLVHVLNELDDVSLQMNPGFVAFFAFLFAVGMGAVWEIFEYSMDSLFGMNMQKSMRGDPSGLTDTMWDLIVDTLGALVISVVGYQHIRNRERPGFIKRWITAFVASNPKMFSRKGNAKRRTQDAKGESGKAKR